MGIGTIKKDFLLIKEAKLLDKPKDGEKVLKIWKEKLKIRYVRECENKQKRELQYEH